MSLERIGRTPGWATVKIETEGSTYVGKVYVPETKRRLSDVLSDDRLFVNLVDVRVDGSAEVEPYVAISKYHIRTLRILSEGEGDR